MSRISGSISTSMHDGPRAFCVVCGTFSDDLVLRNSGLKCGSCIGKPANKHYAKLQKRQATQLLSQALPVRSPIAGFDTSSSVPPSDSAYRRQRLNSSYSSLHPTGDDYSSTAGGATSGSSAMRPIEEYISGTAAYRSVVRHVRDPSTEDHTDTQQRTPADSGTGAGCSASTSDDSSPWAAADNNARAAATSGVAAEDRRTPPPLVTSRAGAGGKRVSNVSGTGSVNSASATPIAPPCRRASEEVVQQQQQQQQQQGVSGPTSSHSSMAPPSRLPPRNVPATPQVTLSSTASSAAAATTGAAGGKSRPATTAAHAATPNTATTTPTPTTPCPVHGLSSLTSTLHRNSVTVLCVEEEEEDTASERLHGMPRHGIAAAAPSRVGATSMTTTGCAETASDTAHSRPSTSRDDVASSSAASCRHQPAHNPHPAPTQTPGALHEGSNNPLAPRAASLSNSISSSTVGRCSRSLQPQTAAAPAAITHGGHLLSSRRGSHMSSGAGSSSMLASAATIAAPPAPASHADPRDSLSAASSSLVRMPRSTIGTAAPGHSSTRRARADWESRTRSDSENDDAASASSSSSSVSSLPASNGMGGGSRAASSASAVSSMSPTSVALAEAAGTSTATRSSAGTGNADHGRRKKRVHGEDKSRHRLSRAATSATPTPGAPLCVNIDALFITVEPVTGTPLAVAPEASTTVSGNSASAVHGAGASSSNDDCSRSTSYTHSRSDSQRSGSLRNASDGYQRQVCAGGQSGGFTVTRHVRHNSGGSDAFAAGNRQRSAHGAALAAESVFAHATTAVEVKKIAYRLVLHDRESGVPVLTHEQRLYTHIIPALERVRSMAGAALPAVPLKRLPSLRFATEAFTEERRAEVATFLEAVLHSPFYIRHPDIVKLLGLEAYVGVPAVPALKAAATGPRATPQLFSGPAGAGGSVATPRQRPGARGARRPKAASAATTSSSTRDGAAQETSAAPGGVDAEATPVHLTADALNAYRATTAATEEGGCRDFSRSQSFTSVHTSRSSVVRRRKLDEITMEDLDHIQLGNLIGRGTFGSVYLGLLQTNRGTLMVAVKVMTIGESVTPSEIEGLQRELDVLCAARHTNIIRFLGSSLNTTTRDLRVFTEYVECGTIRSLVDRFGALTMLAIQQYMHQILSGLRYLHSLSIAHRDIKGDNILVTKNGRVKLSDFGSSTGAPVEVAAVAAASPLTNGEGGDGGDGGGGQGGLPVGSPQYMAPEVIQGTVKSAVAADIWSVGCVGIEMLDRQIWHEKPNMNPFVFLYRISRCGTPPHGLPSDQELAAIRTGGKTAEHDGFAVYQNFLQQCLRVDPTQRPRAGELLNHPFMSFPYSKHLRWMPPAA